MILASKLRLHIGDYSEGSEKLPACLRFELGRDNAHIFISGSSGAGKSVAGQSLALQIASQGVPVLAIDLNQTLSPDHIYAPLSEAFERQAIRHNLYNSPVSSNLITPISRNGFDEDVFDTALGLSDIIERNFHLGPAQGSILTAAVTAVVECREISHQIFPCILDELEKTKLSSSLTLSKRLAPLLRRNIFEYQKDSCTPLTPHIHCFDLSQFPLKMKSVLAELLLYDWFRTACSLQTPIYIMIDEVQHLKLGRNSVLGHTLSEGRKFCIGTLLLSQTLRGFSTEEQLLLSQAGAKLFFKPPLAEVRSHSELLSDPQHRAETIELLKDLTVGQCLLSGQTYIGDDPAPCTDCLLANVTLPDSFRVT